MLLQMQAKLLHEVNATHTHTHTLIAYMYEKVIHNDNVTLKNGVLE